MITEFPLSAHNINALKQQALHWANQFGTVCYLDNNQYPTTFHNFECLIAIDAVKNFYFQKNVFEELKKFYEKEKSWLFGFFTYDLKNQIEKLSSKNFDGIEFPEIHFFSPRYLIEIRKEKIIFHRHQNDARKVFKEISSASTFPKFQTLGKLKLKQRISKREYLQDIKKIQEHILEGDVYEINYCQEFFAERAKINPLQIFWDLNKISLAPFSCFYKLKDKYLLCASPERFLKKIGTKLISQPIKGTIHRGKNKMEDEKLKNKLRKDEKERAENVMIVDLVRNDVSRSSKAGSVKVDELFGIYTFEQVHQIISTVSSELRRDVHFIDAIKNAFPMGSMTGAPKIMAMELIEHYEKTKRGLYSGSVGYITPDGDFDFNVVIRSILYNAANQYLSFQVGGAIVYDSIPEKDYQTALNASEILFGNATKETLLALSEKELLEIFEGVPQSKIAKTSLENKLTIVDFLSEKTKIFPSKAEVRRNIDGISINKEKVPGVEKNISKNDLLNNRYILVQRGKKNYFLVIAE